MIYQMDSGGMNLKCHFSPIGRVSSNNARKSAFDQRNILSNYFVFTVGELKWQYKRIVEGSIQ